MNGRYDFFWNTMELCNWDKAGNDDKVLKPVLQYLSQQDDAAVFEFDDLMSELLYGLDTKKLAGQCRKVDPKMCDDTFLYSRCAALINGPAYYEKVKQGKEKNVWTMEFESLLYVPMRAWALKHHGAVDDYDHVPPLSCETGSNRDGWK